MRQMKKKRFFSVLLILSLVMSIVQPYTIAAPAPEEEVTASSVPGPVIYEPMTTDYGIFNRFNYDNQEYYNDYAKKSIFYNAVANFQGLVPIKSYDINSSYFTEHVWQSFAVIHRDPNTGKMTLTPYGHLIQTGQLYMNVGLTMRLNNHSHGFFLFSESTTVYPYVMIYGTDSFFMKKLSGYDVRKDKGNIRFGDDTEPNYMKLEPSWLDHELRFAYTAGRTNKICSCFDTFIRDIVVTFADLGDVTFKDAYTCDENGNPQTVTKAGNTLYLKVEFSEPIRFADNSPNHGDITVEVSTASGDILTAHLIKLKDNYLLFKFDDTNTDKNLTLTSVNLYSLYGGKDKWWPLESIFGYKWRGYVMDKEKYGKEPEGPEGYTVSSTLITDLAGNPYGSSQSANYTGRISNSFIDGEAPYVKEIAIVSRNMNNDDIKKELGTFDSQTEDSLDASDINAGVGDTVTYAVKFNEVVLINQNRYDQATDFDGIRARLNVKRNDGQYVWLQSTKVSTAYGGPQYPDNGVSNKYYSVVTLEPFVIEPGMICEDPGRNIKVVAVEPVSSDIKITDLSDNEYTSYTNLLDTNQLYLDVIPPTVSFATGSGTSYSPVPIVQEGKLIKEFYIPITIRDTDPAGNSGTNVIHGSFIWINGLNSSSYPFQYAVTAETDIDTASLVWQNGYTGQIVEFDQIESGNRIYIRLLEGEPYDLRDTILYITGKDYAGNRKTEGFPLDYTGGRVAPSASVESVDKALTGEDTGIMTVYVNVEDYNSGLEQIAYAWVPPGSGAPAEDSDAWIPRGGFSSGTQAVSIAAPTEEIGIGVKFQGDLYIKAKDEFGNILIRKLGMYTYDLSEPRMNLVYSDRPTQTASLTIQSLDTDAAVIAMVKKPGTEKGVLCDVSRNGRRPSEIHLYRFVPEYRLLQRNPAYFRDGYQYRHALYLHPKRIVRVEGIRFQKRRYLRNGAERKRAAARQGQAGYYPDRRNEAGNVDFEI
jgi:hypothetical protein